MVLITLSHPHERGPTSLIVERSEIPSWLAFAQRHRFSIRIDALPAVVETAWLAGQIQIGEIAETLNDDDRNGGAEFNEINR